MSSADYAEAHADGYKTALDDLLQVYMGADGDLNGDVETFLIAHGML